MKLLTHSRDKLGDFQSRVLLHIPIGFIIVASCLAHWSITIALCYIFVRYEENEDVHEQDKAWKDYFGAIVGGVIASATILILKILEVIQC